MNSLLSIKYRILAAKRHKAFELSMEFFDYIDKHDKSHQIEYIYLNWKPLFSKIWTSLGGHKKDVEFAFVALSETNWEHLHLTEEEEQYDLETWIDRFKYDIFYCSDRWSFARLYRVNWMYNQIRYLAKLD